MQPWQGHVVLGATLAKLTETVREVALTDNGKMGHEREYKYYPDEFFEPFLARRRVVGFGLYDLIGIGKGDRQRMREQGARNYVFFDAPVGAPKRKAELLGKIREERLVVQVRLGLRYHGFNLVVLGQCEEYCGQVTEGLMQATRLRGC